MAVIWLVLHYRHELRKLDKTHLQALSSKELLERRSKTGTSGLHEMGGMDIVRGEPDDPLAEVPVRETELPEDSLSELSTREVELSTSPQTSNPEQYRLVLFCYFVEPDYQLHL
ncbi:hypothetical protein F5Y19DRAFT_490787 [Xylariaceae sp. FL1651]|nr:hypothetical protein F5Y19DRAFT_490787 [Xylariaceae sp. FL1651]